jgi:protein ImuB
MISGVVRGSVADQTGPYILSGGWWVREVRRDYYYVETRRGELLWVYYDRRRRGWFLHGRVE